MQSLPEQIVDFYSVSYFDPVTKKRLTSRWKMTEEDAAKHFAGRDYHILFGTKEQRRIGGDWQRNCLSTLGKNQSANEDEKEPYYYIWYLDDAKGWQQSETRHTIRNAARLYAKVEWDPIWPSESFSSAWSGGCFIRSRQE